MSLPTTASKARQLAMSQAAEALRDLQQVLANLGRDPRRTSPQFQQLMTTYKSLGAKLHVARHEVAPAPLARPAPRPAAQAPRSVSALGSIPRRVAPAPPVTRAPVFARVLAQAGQAYAALEAQQEPAAEATAAPELTAEFPLPLPKFTSPLGPPGSNMIDLGPPVVALQELLVALGHNLEVNGDYDAETFYAVQKLQKEHKLAVNGLVGLETRRLLNTLVTGDN